MVSLQQLRERLRRELPRLEKDYSVASLVVFGSYARGEETAESDLDILVTFHTVPGFFRYVRLEDELSALLGVQVDLVMKDALKPRIRQEAVREALAV